MADKTKLALDKTGLKSFVDNQIVPFANSLDKIANQDSDEGVTMDSLLGKGKITEGEKEIFKVQHPLSIGQLANDDSRTHGKAVVAAITDTAQSISDVYVKQIKLFNDLHRNLDTTITKLMDGQHDNLEKIDGKIFLDSLGTLPGDFQGTGGSQQS
ncbi:type VII secretion system-associated protein [Actinoallomurus iriomotensis]|uniref:Type VII secretion system-associated protein n=1 Tax=Actinoallomurus iriomotensis TaxID=478107 RepID=A0A9W6S427_9ACTN|nr:type VII secretion system-associated protein [Actinoallomurus iriomotensis]GLY86788.1 hypothetical protein Airi02_047170 [Actinoallomurus iriomotensis]